MTVYEWLERRGLVGEKKSQNGHSVQAARELRAASKKFIAGDIDKEEFDRRYEEAVRPARQKSAR